MFHLSNYDFTYIRDKIVKSEESLINTHVDECLKSESAISSMWRMHRILDTKYEKSDLNKVMTKKCQHLATEEGERFLYPLYQFEYMFDDMLGKWNITTVKLELKYDRKSICSWPYPAPRVHKTIKKK